MRTVAFWKTGFLYTPQSATARFSAVTPASRTRLFMASSTSGPVGSCFQEFVLIPTVSPGPTIFRHAAAGSLTPKRVVTASSSIFWMTAPSNFLSSRTALESRTRTTREAWAIDWTEAVPPAAGLAGVEATEVEPVQQQPIAPATGATAVVLRKSLRVIFFRLIERLLSGPDRRLYRG